MYVACPPNAFPYAWVCIFASQGFDPHFTLQEYVYFKKVISCVVERCRFSVLMIIIY